MNISFGRRYSWITNNKGVLCKICKRDNLKKDFLFSRNYLIIFISLNLSLSYILLFDKKFIFEPTMMKICHGHNSKSSYEMNFILWSTLKEDGGSDTTYAKEGINPCKNTLSSFNKKL